MRQIPVVLPLGRPHQCQDTTWMTTPRISQWSADERPRERLFTSGVAQLSDSEILAILLGHGGPKLTGVDLTRTRSATGSAASAPR